MYENISTWFFETLLIIIKKFSIPPIIDDSKILIE